MNKPINTHGLRIDFGKHKGELYTRVPVSYLNWMVNENHHQKDIAKAELERRGTTMPTLELSGHAIDRFSQRFWNRYEDWNDKGLHSWMMEMAQFALDHGDQKKPNHYTTYSPFMITWVFEQGDYYPVLKTVL